MKRFFRSLKHAMRGLHVAFVSGRNLRIQLVVTVLVLILAILFVAKIWEVILLLLLCAAVMTLELFNTVVERMVDGMSPRLKPMVRDIKDMMAAAVLFVSGVAAIVGLIIFVPYFLRLVGA